MSARDFRVSLDFFDHPKTMRLEAAAGERAVLALLRLWCWSGRHRTSGELTGLSPKEIAAAARWKGRVDALLAALESTGWVDRQGDRLYLHDWADWQGWVCGSGARSRGARIAAITKRCLLTGMTPDAYLDAEGGELASDADLRTALREAHGKAIAKRANGLRSGVRAESESRAQRSRPYPSPTPTPSPTGEGGEAAALPTSPVPGSVAPPPEAEPDRFPPPNACRRCQGRGSILPTRGPNRFKLAPCPDCQPQTASATSDESPPATVACGPPRLPGAARTRSRWCLARPDDA